MTVRAVTLAAMMLLASAVSALAASVEQRVALVIGNGAYRHSPELANPPNDAHLMQGVLEELGFKVIPGINLDKRGMEEKMREFVRALATADTALFFYVGHAVQVSGRNYLLPVEAQLDTERDLQFETISADLVLQQMKLQREDKTSIVFLDACRNNPLATNLARSMGTRSAALGRGLAQMSSGAGMFISYSTQPGNVALDGDGRNSPYTEALARRIKAVGRPLNSVMIDVRNDVRKSTDGAQVPWDHSAMTGEFFFVPPAAVTAAAPTTPSNAEEVAALKERMRQLEEQLSRKPNAETPPTHGPAASGVTVERRKTAGDSSSSSVDVTARRPEGPRLSELQTKDLPLVKCRVIGRVLREPIQVATGDVFCADGGKERARIVAVWDYGVQFVTDGQYLTTCKPGQRCSFNWVGAPIFTSRVAKPAGASDLPTAELVPLN